jgi:hypothetical protein
MNIFPENKQSEDAVSKAVKYIVERNKTGIDALNANHKLAFDAIWNGDTQAIMDKFGNDAYKLFFASSMAQKMVYEVYQMNGIEYTFLIPPKNYTVNEDGTVTIIPDSSSSQSESSESSESSEEITSGSSESSETSETSETLE